MAEEDDKGLSNYADSVADSAVSELHLPAEHAEAVRVAMREAVKMGARAQQRVFESAAPEAPKKKEERADIQRVERLRAQVLAEAAQAEKLVVRTRLQLVEAEEGLSLLQAKMSILDGIYDSLKGLESEKK